MGIGQAKETEMLVLARTNRQNLPLARRKGGTEIFSRTLSWVAPDDLLSWVADFILGIIIRIINFELDAIILWPIVINQIRFDSKLVKHLSLLLEVLKLDFFHKNIFL